MLGLSRKGTQGKTQNISSLCKYTCRCPTSWKLKSQILSVTPPHFKEDKICGITLHEEHLNWVGLQLREKEEIWKKIQRMSVKPWRRWIWFGYLLILPIQDLGAVSVKWPETPSKQVVQMSVLLSQHISSLRNIHLRMLLVLKYLQEFKRWTAEWMKKSEKE